MKISIATHTFEDIAELFNARTGIVEAKKFLEDHDQDICGIVMNRVKDPTADNIVIAFRELGCPLPASMAASMAGTIASIQKTISKPNRPKETGGGAYYG